MEKIKENWKQYGAYVLAVLILLGLTVMLFEKSKDNREATRSFFAMDTYMTITVYGKDCDKAVKEAEKIVHELDDHLSTGNTNSEISRINQEKLAELSTDARYLIEESLRFYQETNGAFDISIYPLARLWGFTGESQHVPTATDIDDVLSKVGAETIRVTGNRVELATDMEIDLGGIAKGYAAQKIADVFKQYDIVSAKLDLGGNIQLVGAKPDGSNWRIAIRHPKSDTSYLGVVTGKNIAIVTSGGYERYFEENGVRYHHILDPHTGYPVDNGVESVTIVCKDGTMADALSTSLFVLGKDDASEYWRNHAEDFEMIMYLQDGSIYVTEGLKNTFTSEYSYQYIMR